MLSTNTRSDDLDRPPPAWADASLKGPHPAPGTAASVISTRGGAGVLRVAASRVSGRGRLQGGDPAAQALLGRARAALGLLKTRAGHGHLAAAIFDAVDIELRVTLEPDTLAVGARQARETDLALFLALASLFSGQPLSAGLVSVAGFNAQGQLQAQGDATLAVAVAQHAGLDTLLLAAVEPVARGLPVSPTTPLRCVWLASVDDALREVWPGKAPGVAASQRG